MECALLGLFRTCHHLSTIGLCRTDRPSILYHVSTMSPKRWAYIWYLACDELEIPVNNRAARSQSQEQQLGAMVNIGDDDEYANLPLNITGIAKLEEKKKKKKIFFWPWNPDIDMISDIRIDPELELVYVYVYCTCTFKNLYEYMYTCRPRSTSTAVYVYVRIPVLRNLVN